jgi:hypothetical protein
MSNLSDLYPSGGSEVVAQTLLDHFVLLNGDAEALQVLLANDVTPASFATWISGSGKEAKFTQLISAPNGAAAVAASSTAMDAVIASSLAMTAVAASSTAMNAVIASSTAMDAVAASSTAMTAVAASSTAMDAVFASSTSKLAVYNSDTALTAIQFNPTSVQAFITANIGIVTLVAAWAGGTNYVANNTKIIILRRFYSGTEHDYINWTRGSTTNGTGHGPTAGTGGRTLYTTAQALGTVSGSYNSNGIMPTTNNNTANFVCAANGLRRHNANNGATMTVIYALVGA